MLTYDQARQIVVDQVKPSEGSHRTISTNLWDAAGYVLGQEVAADRDYPPFNRSTRDGYAVRASDARSGATLRCVGEIKAGDTVDALLAPEACIQIMTGAGIPTGADAVVMIEHTQRVGEQVTFVRDTRAGQ